MRRYEPADVHALFFLGDGHAVWPVASTGATICRAGTVGARRIGNGRGDRGRLRQLERFYRNVPRDARNNAEPVLWRAARGHNHVGVVNSKRDATAGARESDPDGTRARRVERTVANK